MIRKIICLAAALIIIIAEIGKNTITALAEDDDNKTIEELLEGFESQYIAVYEANTQTLICGKNEGEKRYISHLTKLMTALIVNDQIKAGKISYDTRLTTSEYANSMQGVQIWLDVGEEITVDELIKAITISNANDAAVVLAEGCCGSEKAFVDKMNKKAKAIGMDDTVFADCTGISENNVSTASDMSILIGELAKNNVFDEYFKMRIAEVGRKGSQLVIQNKLIGNYKGCCGYKSCYSETSGELLCAASKQRDMVICTVILGGEDADIKFSEAKAVMNYTFTRFEIYYPEIPKEAAADISVLHGQSAYVKTEISDCRDIIIERGSYRQIFTKLTVEESIDAPVSKGDKVGTLVFCNDKGEILKCSVCAAEDVREMDFIYALKCLLYNLFNI